MKMTMPGRYHLQRFLYKAVKAKCEYALIEVTSQGVMQNRHKFINFDIGIFTNLQREHIEAHGSFEKYKNEKLRFFKHIELSRRKINRNSGGVVKKRLIINSDDECAQCFSDFKVDEKANFGLWESAGQKKEFSKSFIAKNFELGEETSFMTDKDHFVSPLHGKFNLYNILASVAFCRLEKIKTEEIQESLKKIDKIPGRMELMEGGGLMTVIDYAHTPDSQEALYRAVLLLKKKEGKMLCLFGSAGGGRDKWKRPEMAKIAQKYCDVICITNEDPYNEDPEKILDDIQKGMSPDFLKKEGVFYRILDRKDAIYKILSIAGKNDAVVFSGKGNERWIEKAGGKIPWNEKKTALEALSKMNK